MVEAPIAPEVRAIKCVEDSWWIQLKAVKFLSLLPNSQDLVGTHSLNNWPHYLKTSYSSNAFR